MVLPREFEVNALVSVGLFLPRYVALSRPEAKSHPISLRPALGWISSADKRVADLSEWDELLSGCEKLVVVSTVWTYKGFSRARSSAADARKSIPLLRAC